MKPTRGVLDPTTDAKDFFGDTTGLTGITETNKPNDDLPKESYSQKEYQKNLVNGMSNVTQEASNDTASEEEHATTNNPISREIPHTSDQTQDQPVSLESLSPSVQGEQSISGDMPAPESDDDTLENAHAVGEQLDEDEEHPKPLDLGEDIDKAEEYLKTH